MGSAVAAAKPEEKRSRGGPDQDFVREPPQLHESIGVPAGLPRFLRGGAIGSQAVGRLLQRKASAVGESAGAPAQSETAGVRLVLQRKCACGEGSAGSTDECEECSRKKLGLQTKLGISQPGDVYEREADRVAEQVMQMPAPGAGLESVPPKIGTKCTGCEEFRNEATAAGIAPSGAPASVHEVLRSPGQPLDAATRAYFEPRFGRKFSRVRVHTDGKAAESARALKALAYTLRGDIVFGAGRFASGTYEGRLLLAHELAHVVQQSDSNEPTGPTAGSRVAVMQKTRTPMLQGVWFTEEPAGGCGVCYKEVYPKAPAAHAGQVAHGVIQEAFKDTLSLSSLYRLVEFPYYSPTGSGKLDLAIATPTGFKIGEIKPANPAGYEQGVEDLDWYLTTLHAAYPLSTIEMMDVRAPSGLQMPDWLARMSGCQGQSLNVMPMRPGLYGYWCEPPFSELRRKCPCRLPDPRPVPEKEPVWVPSPEPVRVPSPEPARVPSPEPARVPSPEPVYGCYGPYPGIAICGPGQGVQADLSELRELRERVSKITGLTGIALTVYLIFSEGSRIVFPPRNIIPAP